MRSESLDEDPLVELGERLDVRRDAAAPRDEPVRLPLAPAERLAPEDRLAPDERVAFFAAEADDRFEPVAFFAAEADDRFEPVAFFAVEPVLRLARPAPLDAAAALVCRDAAGAFVCPLLESEERDDALDVLLAELRAVVAALREPPLPVLALLLVAF